MRALRLIKGVTKRDRLRNTDTREELNIKQVLEVVKRNILRLYSHIMRMEQGWYSAKYYQWKPRGNRPAGRPKKRWRDGVSEATEAGGSSL